MAAPASKTAPVPAWRNLNTPQTLWAGLYILWALDVLLLVAAIAGARVHRGAMQTIGKDSAHSIIAAQTIKTSLAAMDADVANELLGKPGEMQSAVQDYEVQRKKAATALIGAARNITYAGEQEAIEAMQIGMGTYEAKVQQARDLHDRGDAGYVAAYREAATVMDDSLLPEADKLDKVNLDQLESAYSAQSGKSVATMFFMLFMGAALLAGLVAIQSFLSKKTRRVLNPMLVLATFVTLGFIFYTFSALAEERHDRKVAKVDAFTSIHALWRARAVAYSANTDESRYLLDGAHAREHEQNFREKAAALVGKSFEARDGKITGFTGYLADELNNITFEGERDAGTNELARFVDYLDIDGRIRSFEENGKHAEALALCLGTQQGESDWAFDQFDSAIGKTLDINQKAFDAAVGSGFAALSHFEIKAAVVAVIIALLAFLGLIKRIQEYR